MRAGLAAEFLDEASLLRAIEALRAAGYRALDVFTPHPVPEAEEALHLGRSRLNWLVFPLGMGGAAGAFLIQAWCNGYDYPLNVGGRPPFAWISNIPITFESGVLATALAGFVALFWVLGLPRLTHPLFKVEGFERASLDRFWLAVDGDDPRVARGGTARLLERLGALGVTAFGGFVEARR